MRTVLLALLAAAFCLAQDAGLVLRTMVGYNTQLASSDLTPEKKAEVAALGKQAGMASASGRYGEALKLLHKGTALMRGFEWTPAVSLAASLHPALDHAVWEPGQNIELKLARYYEPDSGAPESITGAIEMRPLPSGQPVKLATLTKEQTTFTVPADLAPGRYRMEITVAPVPLPKTLNIAVAPGVKERAEKLASRLARFKDVEGPAPATASYAVELVRRADRSEIDPSNFDLPREIAYGEELAASLDAKKDPFASRTGDMRRAYRSKVDNTLQPYRLYVPTSYDKDKPAPLLIALHGMGGDENVLFDRYNSDVKEQAAKHGYIVATPKGREPTSMYRGSGERDVMDVLADVRASYNVDPDRIYMMGHSMGGYGTWSIAMNHPDVFAGLAPVAGGGNAAGMEKIKHIPQIVFHGDNDKTVNVQQSRTMVEAAKKLGVTVKYVETPGGNHGGVFVPAVPQMFEFFNQHRRAKPSAASSGR